MSKQFQTTLSSGLAYNLAESNMYLYFNKDTLLNYKIIGAFVSEDVSLENKIANDGNESVYVYSCPARCGDGSDYITLRFFNFEDKRMVSGYISRSNFTNVLVIEPFEHSH